MARSRFLAISTLISILAILISPLFAAAQAPARPSPDQQLIENYLKRVGTELSLTPDQADTLRSLLMKHIGEIHQLAARQQGQPYSPQVQAAIEDETKTLTDEFEPSLTDEQKRNLRPDLLRPIPPPPGSYAVGIPPRPESNAPLPQDRLVAAVTAGRAAKLTDDQKILQLLDRITFGPRPGDLERVKRIGISAYIDQQLHPENIDDSLLEKRLVALPTLRLTAGELLQYYPQPNQAMQRAKEKNAPPVFGRPQQISEELLQQKLLRAVYSDRQLQEVMTDFWFNHFNVFAQKGGSELYMLPGYERDVIRPNSLGKFHDLLLAVAQSPAMLFYLDNWLSTSNDAARPKPGQPAKPPQPPKPPVNVSASSARLEARPAPAHDVTHEGEERAKSQQTSTPPVALPKPAPRKEGINENYGRELMELHTLGVNGGYTQKDVQEVARCLTGWTIDRAYQEPVFVFRPWMHDFGEKTVLGVRIPAGGGISDGLRVLDILSKSPATAHFISLELCERFVSDDPPKALVDRVAQVFLNTDGDIREVMRAILTSPEFNSPAAFRSKIKSPLEFVASSIRALDGDTDGGPPIQSWINRMGEPLYDYQFPTGYGENSSRWVNTGAILDRLNFGLALVNNQIRGTSLNLQRMIPESGIHDQQQLAGRVTSVVVHTNLSAQSVKAIEAALKQPNSAAVGKGPDNRAAQNIAYRKGGQAMTGPERMEVAEAVALIMGSAEFQKR